MMETRTEQTISRLRDWEEVRQFEENARARGAFEQDIGDALQKRSLELGRLLIAEKANLDLSNLTPAENKIVHAVAEYVALMRRKGKYPGRTLRQLKNRGLLEAAETAVSRKKAAQGYSELADANLEDLSYEQAVLDHPEEFSERALWFARKTAGLPNAIESPPAEGVGATQVRTARLLTWLKERAKSSGGLLFGFANADTANAMGMSDTQR